MITAISCHPTPTRRAKNNASDSYSHRYSAAQCHPFSPFSLHEDKTCKKNPGHSEFIPINSLEKCHFLEDFKDDFWVDWIKTKGPETVRLKVSHTSVNRPDELEFRDYKNTKRERNGSGTVFMMNMDKIRPCPFRDCPEKNAHNVSGVFKVMTASHVVYDNDEALNTEIYFFHDNDDDDSNVVKARGLRVSSVNVSRNRSIMECVSHDLTLCKKLAAQKEQRMNLLKKMKPTEKEKAEKMVVMISHPHGKAKHVTVGSLVQLAKDSKSVQVDDLTLVACQVAYTTPTCPGSGGGSVNVLCSQRACIAFAPHCACGENKREGISGLGWTLLSED